MDVVYRPAGLATQTRNTEMLNLRVPYALKNAITDSARQQGKTRTELVIEAMQLVLNQSNHQSESRQS